MTDETEKFEEQYQDVLQNIEFPLSPFTGSIQTWRTRMWTKCWKG
jgi:hypothetical protein